MNGVKKHTIWKKMTGILLLAVSLCLLQPHQALASVQLSGSPYASVEYDWPAGTANGTVRYISQVRQDPLRFYNGYWGRWASSASHECGTSCISMALSYCGIDVTPQTILDTGGGRTIFTYGWGGASYSTPSFAAAYANYENGRGMYSPPIINLAHYSSGGHFVLVVSKTGTNTYQALDPWSTSGTLLTLTINGTSVRYTKSGLAKSDSVYTARQYYNPNASVTLDRMAVRELKQTAPRKIKVYWNANPALTGYQIQYSTAKDMSGFQRVTVKGGTAKNLVLTGVKKGQTYYIRIRSFVKTSSKNIYSKWSPKKTITVAK